MNIRKLSAAAALFVSAVAGSGGAVEAAGPETLVFDPFTAHGTIYNEDPPLRVPTTEMRVYMDGDNFTLKPVTYATPLAAKRQDADGALGIRTTPRTEYFIDGEPTDFAGAIVEGCTTEVEGFVINIPTQIGRDDLRASTVSTTC